MIRTRPSLGTARMMTLSWLRFEWDLKTLSADELNLPPPFVLTRAGKGRRTHCAKRCPEFLRDGYRWSDIQRIFAETILRHVQAGFQRSLPDCVIVQHGSRIIGASIVDPSAEAENHLTTGPCVLHEYRGRGVGTALLEASLAALQQSDLVAPTASSGRKRRGKVVLKIRRFGRAVVSGFWGCAGTGRVMLLRRAGRSCCRSGGQKHEQVVQGIRDRRFF